MTLQIEIMTATGTITKTQDEMALQRGLRQWAKALRGSDPLDRMGQRLQAAHPHLILAEADDGKIVPYIREIDPGWDELISESYDRDGNRQGPVFWRIVRRGAYFFYCSTFSLMRDQVISTWGPKGLAACDPMGTAVAQIESVLADDNVSG